MVLGRRACGGSAIGRGTEHLLLSMLGGAPGGVRRWDAGVTRDRVQEDIVGLSHRITPWRAPHLTDTASRTTDRNDGHRHRPVGPEMGVFVPGACAASATHQKARTTRVGSHSAPGAVRRPPGTGPHRVLASDEEVLDLSLREARPLKHLDDTGLTTWLRAASAS